MSDTETASSLDPHRLLYALLSGGTVAILGFATFFLNPSNTHQFVESPRRGDGAYVEVDRISLRQHSEEHPTTTAANGRAIEFLILAVTGLLLWIAAFRLVVKKVRDSELARHAGWYVAVASAGFFCLCAFVVEAGIGSTTLILVALAALGWWGFSSIENSLEKDLGAPATDNQSPESGTAPEERLSGSD